MFDKKNMTLKSNLADNLPAPTSKVEKNMDISPFLKDIEDTLQITSPTIISVAYLFELFDPRISDYVVHALRDFIPRDIPSDSACIGAYYHDESDQIYVGRKVIKIDLDTNRTHFRNVHSAEKLFFLAHEFRHVWQKKYAAEKYYKKNAVGKEVVNDIAEIDADAFAFAFFFSERTPFAYKDVAAIAEYLCLQAAADNGKRWQRVEKLSEKYSLNCTEKLDEFKANIDQSKIDRLIPLIG